MSNKPILTAVNTSARMIVSASVIVGPVQNLSLLSKLGAIAILGLWIGVPVIQLINALQKEVNGEK
mgnify:CR=1 FL=1